MERDEGEKCRRQHRTDDAFQIVGQPGERQRARVFLLVRQDVGDRRLEGRREGGRGRLQHEDQNIDLPNLGDERQENGNGGADEIERHQHGAPRHTLGECRCDRRDTDIGDHLDGERGPQHRAGLRPRQFESQQAQRHRRKAGSHQCDDLCQKEVAIGPVFEDRQHHRYFAISLNSSIDCRRSRPSGPTTSSRQWSR